ncbi:hypothetical protein TWF696_003700 [Orbilia brochopaga]|uniref:Uncharacterized protein n=1 Tax=Orbilia brochopaga TaxID=3140254 RepID=A0AAV9V480_9PEZI
MGLERMAICSLGLMDDTLQLKKKEEELILMSKNNDKRPPRSTETYNQECFKRKTVDADFESIHSLIRLSASSMTEPHTQRLSSPQSSHVPKKLPKGNVRQPQCSSRPPRDPRPMYSQEEADAILYYRDSVQLPWKKVVDAWNNLYDVHTGRRWGPRTISGLQSHYYRMLGFDKSNGRRPSAPNPEIGLLKTSDRRYWWTYGMHPSVMDKLIRATPKELKDAAKQHVRRLRKEAHKGPRRQRKITKRLADQGDIICLDEDLPATMIEDLAVPDIKVDYSEDMERLPSVDNFEQQSASDSDGFVDTDSSVSSPPSSRTSLTPSPRASLDLGSRPSTSLENPKVNITALPSFRMLDSIAGQGAYSPRTTTSPTSRLDRHIPQPRGIAFPSLQYLDSFRVSKYSKYDTPKPTSPRLAYRNPMAFSNILSVSS